MTDEIQGKEKVVAVANAPEEIQEVLKKAADPTKRYTLKELFPNMPAVQERLQEGKIATVITKNKAEVQIASSFDAEGNVLSLAAAVPRTPTRSDRYLRDSVPDLSDTAGLSRKDKIQQFRQLARKEGIVNNAIKKKAALISQDGSFQVEAARQGRGKSRASVVSELLTLLTYWQTVVNSSPEDAALTGSRGIKQIVRRGSRQAMIEGDLFIREVWQNVKIPILKGKTYKLPILLHAIPAEDIEIVEDLTGFGYDLYYWVPSQTKLNAIRNPTDPDAKKMIEKSITPKMRSELNKNGKVKLDPALLIHIKNAGTDADTYGESEVEAALTDIAYSRALKALDFVTIDSLVNRMLVIKIGDENPESDYHNLGTAQQRLATFSNLIQNVGPNMLILWAGHDVSATEMGAHNQILNTDKRHDMAHNAIKMATGVPDPLLTGSADGGNAVAWAGFISLAAVASELQEEWAQALTQLGRRIAEQNGYDDVDLSWEFAHRLLADREANAKLMIQTYQLGGISMRSLLEELGKDFDVEKQLKIEELENGDTELFAPVYPQGGGPAGDQGPATEDQPGRPSREDTTKVGPDRDREDKDTGQPQEDQEQQ